MKYIVNHIDTEGNDNMILFYDSEAELLHNLESDLKSLNINRGYLYYQEETDKKTEEISLDKIIRRAVKEYKKLIKEKEQTNEK